MFLLRTLCSLCLTPLSVSLMQSLMQVHLKIQDETRKHRQQHRYSQSIPVSPFMIDTPVIHFIETAPSVLRELPWVKLREHKVSFICFLLAPRVYNKGGRVSYSLYPYVIV